MIVTVTGANSFGRKRALDELVQAFVAEHGDMALERVDGEDASYERLVESIQSLPFLSARKLVVLREPSKQKTFAEEIESVLAAISDSTDVIFYEPKLDKRTAYYKTLKKKTDFREYNNLDAGSLARWAVDYVKAKNGSLSFGDANKLVDRLGAEQQLLQSELDKLLIYDENISRQTIDLLVEPLPQSTVFELLDAAFAGNSKRAFELYKEQRALKVEPQAIIAMLAWQLHVLAVVKAAGELSPADIAKQAKLSPFVVQKSAQLARKLSLEHIKQLVADLLQIDTKLKRTNLDADEALQLFLLKLVTK